MLKLLIILQNKFSCITFVKLYLFIKKCLNCFLMTFSNILVPTIKLLSMKYTVNKYKSFQSFLYRGGIHFLELIGVR